MTNQEIETIRNVIARLRCEPKRLANGENFPRESEEVRAALTDRKAKLYLETWVIGALECLLPEQRDPKLAVSLSR